jgi:hypothetical protein
MKGLAHENAAIDLAQRELETERERRGERWERHDSASSPIDGKLRFWKTWDWESSTSTVHDTLTGERAEFDLRSAFECFECAKWVEGQRAKAGDA